MTEPVPLPEPRPPLWRQGPHPVARPVSRREALRAASSLGLAAVLALGLEHSGLVRGALRARAAPLRAPDEQLIAGRDAALEVLRRVLTQVDGYAVHWAGERYKNPWIRDSFAWGSVPIYGYPELDPYVGSELGYWLAHQHPSGQWVTDPQSGYWDETAILIAAMLDAYRVTGDRALLTNNLRRLENGWLWLYAQRQEGSATPHLVYAELDRRSGRPPVASDWADQIARGNWATGVNMLWYHATRSLAVIERLAGRHEQGQFLDDFALGIKREINTLLWRVSPVMSVRAAPTPAFGHYTGWTPGPDYFEVDTNLLAIIYGVAEPAQAGSIVGFIDANWGYLMGSEYGPPAAKVVYGDYAPDDWAAIRFSTAPGAYHMAYWVNVGALAALAYREAGQPERVRSLLLGLANSLIEARGTTGVREWYAQDGTAHGSEQYGWAARCYLVALYRAYLGVDADWTDPLARNLQVNPSFGGVSGEIIHLGKRILIEVHGPSIGRYRYAQLGDTRLERTVIPESLLRDGVTLHLYVE